MRVTYDADTDAAYVFLTDEALPPGRDRVPCDLPEGVQHAYCRDGLERRDSEYDLRDSEYGRIAGLEVLEASKVLHRDLLDSAERVAARSHYLLVGMSLSDGTTSDREVVVGTFFPVPVSHSIITK
jgi:uncharacterized protein YuzE